MKSPKLFPRILISSTLIGLLIAPSAAVAGKFKFGRSNSSARQPTSSSLNRGGQSVTANSTQGSVPQMKRNVVNSKSLSRSPLNATTISKTANTTNPFSQKGISNRTLSNAQKSTIATGTNQPANVLARKAKTVGSTLPSTKSGSVGMPSTELKKPSRRGDLKISNLGKSLPASSAIRLAPAKNKPIQTNSLVERPLTTGSRIPGRQPLAPGLALVDRTSSKKPLAKKMSEQSPLPAAPQGDAAGTATTQFIPPLPSGDDVVDFFGDKAADAGEAIGNAGEAIGDAIRGGAEELGGGISDGAAELGEAIGEAGDNFGGPVDDVADQIGGAVGNSGKQTGDAIGNKGREASTEVREAGNEAREVIQDGAKWGAGQAHDAIDRGEAAAEEIRQRGEDFVNETRDRGEDLATRAEEAANEAREDVNDAIDQFQDDFLGHDRDPRQPDNGGKEPEEDPRAEDNPPTDGTPANGHDDVDNGTPPMENDGQPADEGAQPGDTVEQPVENEPAPEPEYEDEAPEGQYEEDQDYEDNEQYDEECDEDHGHCLPLPFQIWLPGPCPVVQETVIVHTPAPATNAELEAAVETNTQMEAEDTAAELPQVPVGATLELAGKDLGQMAGQVLLRMGALSLPAKVEVWNETITVTLPSFGLAEPVEAEIQIVRADGELDTAVAIELIPAVADTDQE